MVLENAVQTNAHQNNDVMRMAAAGEAFNAVTLFDPDLNTFCTIGLHTAVATANQCTEK